MKPGIHSGIPMAEYLAAPAVSSGLIQTVISECPRKAFHESWLNPHRVAEDSTSAQDAGTIAHRILLEDSMEGIAVIDPEHFPAEKTGNIPDGWTNKAIRAARDEARSAGKTPVLLGDMKTISAMVDSARAFIESLKDTEPAIWQLFQPGGGESELTMVWHEDSGALATYQRPDGMAGYFPCRIRPDRISQDRKLIVDVKTTGMSAEPDAWGRSQLVRMGFYISAAFYRRGVKALVGTDPAYVFLCIEQEPPFLCSLVGVDPAAFDLGARKVEAGLRLWADCVARNQWPAYPARVCYPQIPAYEFAQWDEQEAMRGNEYDPGQLFERTERLIDKFVAETEGSK